MLAFLLFAAACQPRATQTAVSPPITPLILPEGVTAVPLITNLSHPTQFIEGSDGRSNGTLTVSPEGLLIYETSGRRQGNRASDGSGYLWMLDPVQPDAPTVLATGLKNAYAHVFDHDLSCLLTASPLYS